MSTSSTSSWSPPASWPPQSRRNYGRHVTKGSSKNELEVESLAVEAHINEFGLCKTSMTFDFASETKQDGWKIDLFIWLPLGATISNYSVDYQERTKTSEFFMLDACMVDAAKIRSPHPRPGKDERPDAGSFLPPIPAFPPNVFCVALEPNDNYQHTNTKRTVRIEFLSNFEVDPKTGERFYYFPAAMTRALNFKMDINAHLASESKAPAFQSVQFQSTQFEFSSGVYKASFASATDKTFTFDPQDTAIVVRIPPGDTEKPQCLFATPITSRFGSETFFAISVPAQPVSTDPKTSKNRLAIFWDTSLSRSMGNRELDRSIALKIAKAFLESKDDHRVDLYTFNEFLGSRKRFSASKFSVFESTLKDLVYDGATQLKDLHLSDKVAATTSAIVLFTDGNCLTNEVPQLLTSAAPVHVLTQAADKPNTYLLGHVASSSGGFLLEIDSQHKNIDIHSLILSEYGRCPLVKAPEGVEAFSSVVPSHDGHPRVLVVGKTSLKASLELKIGDDAVTLNADAAMVAQSDLLAIMRASMRLRHLYSDADRHYAQIVSISQQFSLPTSLTRLLLIRDDFYSVEIPPPAGMFYGLKSYNEMMDRKTEPEDKSSPTWYFWRDEPYRSQREPQQLMDKWDWTYRPEESIRALSYDDDLIVEETPALIARSIPKTSPITKPGVLSKLWNAVTSSSTSAPEPKVARFDLNPQDLPSGPFMYQLCLADQKAAYVSELNQAKSLDAIESIYHRYLKDQKGSVAFHFDVAWAALHIRSESESVQHRKFARHVIYNIFELNLREKTHWRSLAYLLEAHGFGNEALMAYENAHTAQKWYVEQRELALALIKFGGPNHYQRAIQLLEKALGHFHDNDHVDFVIRVEYNALVARCKMEKVPLMTNPLIADKSNKNVEADIRILLSWDSDDRSVGLFVQEPDGYIVYHKDTSSSCGGFFTNHVREGWGPEQYAIVKAVPGKYRAFARIAERDNVILRQKLLFCRVYFNWARPNQTEHCFVIRPENSHHLVVAEFEIPEGRGHFQSIQVTSGGEMPRNLPFIFPKWPKDGHF